MRTFLLILLGALSSRADVTPLQYLQSLPKPSFNAGHRLPHLTRWGYELASNVNVEFATNWGYCLPLDMDNGSLIDITAGHPGAGYLTLATNFPSKYKLSVIMNRRKLSPTPDGFYCTNSSGQFVDINSNAWTTPVDLHTRVLCPENLPAYEIACASNIAYSLRVIQSNAPVAMVINGGEYDLDIPGSTDQPGWIQDPRVQAAKGSTGWSPYISQAKANKLAYLKTNVWSCATNREFHIFYKTDAERNRTIYALPAVWPGSFDCWNSEVLVPQFDLPSYQSYYEGFESAQWTGNYDLLTTHLNSVGYCLPLGYPTNYTWLSGGWQHSAVDNSSLYSSPELYKGFLKCLYTSGMIGGVAGYFYEPTNGFDGTFPAATPPQWLSQMIGLSQVHATFTYLDDYIFNGTLLSGPQKHQYSIDQPAYEFTNTIARATARVLARKKTASNNWLVCAWAADGVATNVTVSIPTLGTISVRAVASGNLYLGDSNGIRLFSTPSIIYGNLNVSGNLIIGP